MHISKLDFNFIFLCDYNFIGKRGEKNCIGISVGEPGSGSLKVEPVKEIYKKKAPRGREPDLFRGSPQQEPVKPLKNGSQAPGALF